MRILLVGGAGYIGSHTAVALAEAGHFPIIIDDLSNSRNEVLERISKLVGYQVPALIADVRDAAPVNAFIAANGPIDAAIHLAGLKSVAESVTEPARYYDVNVSTTIALLSTMKYHGIDRLVFSSSATVYGSNRDVPHGEEAETGRGITNPYGKTKYFIEEILRDVSVAEPTLGVTSLRYFNPVGAHPSGLIGEDPLGRPNNLMPIIAQVATGVSDHVDVYGTDYPTPDGTGMRDYIHVQDLAEGHVRAAERGRPGFQAINLGTGVPASVLEVIKEYERASGVSIPARMLQRRVGDAAVSYANVDKAATMLGWRAQLTLADACVDSWRWQQASVVP